MAGFDATFRFRPADHDLMAAMMAAGRRRSRTLHLRWHSVIDKDGRAYCRMDGNTFRLDILLERLRRDLPTIAEATSSDRHTPAERRRLANGLCNVLCRWRTMHYDRYYLEGGPDYIPRVRRLKQSEAWAVHVLWPGGTHPDLFARLGVTEEVMASWVLDEVRPEVVIQELHTAAELLLMRLLAKRRAPAVADLVEAGRQKGYLDRGTLRYHYDSTAPERFDDMGDLLISLKDHRKRVKHQGSDEARAWLNAYFWATGVVLERLCYDLKKG